MDTREILGHDYLPRVIDTQLDRLLDIGGAVVIEGPRACGKTMTGLNSARSCAFLDDDATRRLADLAPDAVLDGDRPRLLDEWQLAPQLWNQVRRAVDSAPRPGAFILTGSAVPSDDATRHTGAGRFLRIRQRTMTWFERGASTGTVSLRALINGERPTASATTHSYHDIANALARTGFPALSKLAPEATAISLSGYLDDVVRADLGRLARTRHEPVVVRALIQALARATATEVSWRTLTRDLQHVAPDIRPETLARYVELLERLFIVERVPAWAVGLRSRARLRTAPKFHLADPALALTALEADVARLETDPETTGFIFESAVVHDLLVFTEALDGRVHHYRDSNGHEIDAVLTLPGGRWAAVEVKLGATQIEKGARSLARAVQQIDTSVVGEPALRLVVTGTGPTATLADGTVTCPLSVLGP
ncbi:ATP-binding protein [Actinomyces sp. MRS3W]|uniref:ATP-binding protein n=1 Tax=Actinomyces sp. MRS3W TaxID=2800796 RepID=UPI0028FD1DC8|nr:DUF4143 domain-containing protein [Actinomyces sp. MRS3W]MDU0349242.1 DUF4143 domain-containing protein [Actinomyces sp. MRS3W]